MFRSDQPEKEKSHLKNLLAVALADGNLSRDEHQILKAVARRFDMTEEDINSIRQNPDTVTFSPPSKYDDKLDQMYDLLALMSVDNEIHPNEIKLCKAIAVHLDLAPRIVDDILMNMKKT